MFNYVWCDFGSFCRSGLGCWAAAAAVLFMPELLTGAPLNAINFDLKYVPYETVIVSQTLFFKYLWFATFSQSCSLRPFLDLLECSLQTNGSTKNKIWDKLCMLKSKVKLIIEKDFDITQEHLKIYNYNRICFLCSWIECVCFFTGFYFLFS